MNRRSMITSSAAGLIGLGAVSTRAEQGGPVVPTQPNQGAASTLRVMSFNIRYGTANDGVDHWDTRKDFLIDVIRAEAPDVLGVQEALYPQLAYILKALPDYAMVGVGRDNGVRAGELSAILYRMARLSVSRSDTFWFSDTPERVASTNWGNTITRICTWAQLATPEGQPVYVYNVHLDHQSQPSREKSASLLRSRVDARDPKAPAIVMGDFNAGEQNPAVASMVEGGGLRDTFRIRHPAATPVGTFTGFKFGQVAGEKIDHIFATAEWEVVEAAIVRTDRNQRYPSDHFPVTATLRLKGM